MKQAWTVRLGWLVVGVILPLPLMLTSGQRLVSIGAKRWLDEQWLQDRFPISPSPLSSAPPKQNGELVRFTGGAISDVSEASFCQILQEAFMFQVPTLMGLLGRQACLSCGLQVRSIIHHKFHICFTLLMERGYRQTHL